MSTITQRNAEIRRLAGKGVRAGELMRRFGVSRSQLYNVAAAQFRTARLEKDAGMRSARRSGLTIKQVAERFGVGPDRVKRATADVSVPDLRGKRDRLRRAALGKRRGQVIAMHNAGVPVEMIGRALGVSRTTIHRDLRPSRGAA